VADIYGTVIMYGSYPELAVNGGFEAAGTGGADIWNTWAETAGDGALANETVIVHAGSDAAKITAGATANTKIAQTIAVTAVKPYILNVWARGDGTNSGRYLIYDVTNAANIVAATSLGVTAATWTCVPVSFTTPTSCVSVRIDLMCPAANGGIAYIDDVRLSKASYASNGEVQMLNL
jgi:hypothetical protein